MQISIKAALAGLFGLAALASVGQGVVSVRNLYEMEHNVREIGTARLPAVNLVNQINTAIRDHRVKLYRLVLSSNTAADVEEHRRTLDGVGATIDAMRRAYEAMDKSPEERALYDQFSTLWAKYLAQQTIVVEMLAAGRKSDAVAMLLGPDLLQLASGASDALKKNVAVNKQAAERAVSDCLAGTEEAVRTALVATACVLLLSVLAALFSFFRISLPIARMTTAMRVLAAGDTGITVPGAGRGDEIGAMASAVEVFRDNLVRARRLEAETSAARQSAEEQRNAGMRQMAEGFEAAIGGIATLVSSSATELQATAQSMAGTAAATARQSTTVATAAEEAAANVTTVAAAAEELGSSVQEIGRQVAGSAELALKAVEEAGLTASLVKELNEAMSHIGDVVTVIASIAGQTNLLALNATIEAARAGDAGRGFAVVASEVKLLAGQTARATEDISNQIGRIQASTGLAVQAIDSIGGRIREISGVATAIAAAVEEQGAATQEIVRNVAQAATGTGEVTTTIAHVAGAAEDTGTAASQVLEAASALSLHSERLHAEMNRFVATVRAA
ncbi:methyl-accepting chemotaxis protein [Methylobacterium sp. J-076]|uniref:methyl-accepting chemotaxis protein n=1 Tax=Methylobacterium sp. J-076 TaxID=2836655 RepID=UPI001FB8B633|nr:methyl-accepting chemotaxis protein [Methylobacterium sp. J-076]MCJ2014530.1 methyl-accepting chemotaxis protein [Methylobacterium sp. J-076]